MAQSKNSKSMVVFSLIAVVGLAVSLNNYIVNHVAESEDGRGVASIDQSSLGDAVWDSSKAKDLAVSMEEKKATLGKNPTLRDELLFGSLEGQYQFSQTTSPNEMQLAQVGMNSVAIADKPAFIQKYSRAFQLEGAVKVSADPASAGSYQVFGADSKVIGLVKIDEDQNGRVKTVSVKRVQ